MAKVSKNVFLTAGILTALVFLSGILLGWYLDLNRVSVLQSRISELQTDFDNLGLENSFYQSLANQSALCQLYLDRANRFSEQADKLGTSINNYKVTNQFEKDDIEFLKKRYTVINLNFWLQIVNLKKNCNYNTTAIVYFYKVRDCDDCIAQGLILDSLKKEYNEKVMIFAVDKDVDLGIVNLLKVTYNVTTFPFIIVNEENKLAGFNNATTLRTYIQN